ncbi:reverse transcriptase domain-containing protein [Tanacetum coccineum]
MLNDAKKNYFPLEKLALSLVNMTRRLRRYFEAYPVKVITDQPIKNILSRTEASGKLAKYAVEIGTYKILFLPRNAIKGQVLEDFLSDAPVGEAEEGVTFDRPSTTWVDDTEVWHTLQRWEAASLKGSDQYELSRRATHCKKDERFKQRGEVDSKLVVFLIKSIEHNEATKDNINQAATVPSFSNTNLTKEILVEILNERSTDAKEVQTTVEEEGENWMTPIIWKKE